MVLGEPLVFYRCADGRAVVMDDRCPHRWAPLSAGRLEGDTIRCMYHGICFNGDGQCTEMPEQSGRLETMAVRSYPVIENYQWVWVWMGDPQLASSDSLPDLAKLDDKESYVSEVGYKDMQVNYIAIMDNLLDLSHISFLHEDTLGQGPKVRTRHNFRVEKFNDGVRVSFWRKGGSSLNVTRLKDGGAVDAFHTATASVPGTIILHAGTYPAGTADSLAGASPPPDMPPLVENFSAQSVTPITDRKTRYFYSHFVSRHGADGMDATWEVVNNAFEEDREMLELQQRVIDEHPGDRMVGIEADKGLVMFRSLVHKKLLQEANVQGRH